MIKHYMLDKNTINLGTVKVDKNSFIVSSMTKDGKIRTDILLRYINDTPMWIYL